MIANYHTHSYLCKHATGTIEEYVQQGIKNGLQILGFSDHVPYPFGNGYVSENIRMKVSETKIYVDTLLELKEKYKNDIEILIGYEAEYFPIAFDLMKANLLQYPCDYIICGQHTINNEFDSPHACAQDDSDPAFLHKYVDQMCEAIKLGAYSYIAHPDITCFTGDLDCYIEENKRLCKCAKQYDTPLEINILGLKTHREYPRDDFWKIVYDIGNDVVIGCDAHEPESVANPSEVQLALDYAHKHNIEPLETIKLKKLV